MWSNVVELLLLEKQQCDIYGLGVRVMVSSATFNNISVIDYKVEKIGVPGRRKPQIC